MYFTLDLIYKNSLNSYKKLYHNAHFHMSSEHRENSQVPYVPRLLFW